MHCELKKGIVDSYFDGELDPVRTADFERHVESCRDCSELLERAKFLRARLQRTDLYEHASPDLYLAIRKQLQTFSPQQRDAIPLFRSRFWVPALAVLTTATVFVCGLLALAPKFTANRVIAEVIDAHVRSLQPGHLTDVESSDQHTVKPWFQRKLSFIPSITDYVDQGFPLVGGRLDVIDTREIASLIYYHRKHIINVFVWRYDDEVTKFAGSGSSRGYNWLIWRNGDVVFCAVSDAAPSSLEQLKQLLGS